jgi:hypothetical protein
VQIWRAFKSARYIFGSPMRRRSMESMIRCVQRFPTVSRIRFAWGLIAKLSDVLSRLLLLGN